jgi:hypothetical protein
MFLLAQLLGVWKYRQITTSESHTAVRAMLASRSGADGLTLRKPCGSVAPDCRLRYDRMAGGMGLSIWTRGASCISASGRRQ